MEFEEMQIIWNSQNEEKLFAINETALHKAIQRKSHAVNRSINMVEWLMIGVNLFVSIFLVIDAINDSGPDFQYFVAAIYLGYFFYALYRRLNRRQTEPPFDPTILGELDRALWQVDYLIRQSHSIFYWYVLPLGVIVTIFLFFSAGTGSALGFLLIWLPITFFGARWEINRWWRPKMRGLEALREALTTAEPSVNPEL